jgi:adenylosuccinate synthase
MLTLPLGLSYAVADFGIFERPQTIMANVIVVGAQWGDEGKAKITDLMAAEADVVVRCQGGCNAGHTVRVGEETFKFHLLPSGMLVTGRLCLIGPGTVIAPDVLIKELQALTERGYTTQHLRVSDRAHVTLPYHVALDQIQEKSLSNQKIGTTGRGIGPTYMDKVGRLGLRMGDLYLPKAHLRERLETILKSKEPVLMATGAIARQPLQQTLDQLMQYCATVADTLAPYVCDTVALLHEAVQANRNILFEGAQGTLLDVDYGTYPFVTSSNASAAGACTGSGLGPTFIDRVIGVMKVYTTRVGEGPFPTELTCATGRHLVEQGQEIGTTTGRIRRCGWFDAVVGRYSAMVNGLDGLAFTKLDVLDGLEELKICVAYKNRETGEMSTTFPAQIQTLWQVDPIYETLPGWSESTRNARDWDDLPVNAQRYLSRISDLLGVPISIVSVGPEREETILFEHPLLGEKRQRPSLTLRGDGIESHSTSASIAQLVEHSPFKG